jgi:hypothetical protein
MTTLSPGPYRARRIRPLGLWSAAGFRLKAYAIEHAGPADEALVAAARRMIERDLAERPTAQTTYGVGFVGVHDGRGMNQVFLDLWCNENELIHRVWISPKDDPGALVPPPADFNSVCVWDLGLQAKERDAWLACALARAGGPDLEAYLARRFDGEL